MASNTRPSLPFHPVEITPLHTSPLHGSPFQRYLTLPTFPTPETSTAPFLDSDEEWESCSEDEWESTDFCQLTSPQGSIMTDSADSGVPSSFLPHPPETTPLRGSPSHSCPFQIYPANTTSPTPVIYAAPTLDSGIICADSPTIFLESFHVINGFYQLASPRGFILANSLDFEFELSPDLDGTGLGWRIPVIYDSPDSFISPLYIPDATAKPSAITWWALQMELMVSTFLFHPSAVLDSTLMGWVGHDPFATRRSYYFALRYHSSYFTHLGRAFIPAADILFRDLCDLFCEDPSYMFSFVPREYIFFCHPPVSPPCPPRAQYLPVYAAMSRGGPFAYAQDLPMAFRMARRQIFGIPVFASTLATPQPFPHSFLSSFTKLKRFVLRHLHLVRSLMCLTPSRSAPFIPYHWTHTHAALPSFTTPPPGVRSLRHFCTCSRIVCSLRSLRLKRPFSTSSHVVLIPHLFTMPASRFAALLVLLSHLFQLHAALLLSTLYAFTPFATFLYASTPLDMFPSWTRSKVLIPPFCLRDHDKYPP